MIPDRFNIRVYFLLKNEEEDSVLISDEIIHGKPYTKFPGGGLEFGEGTIDCVKREALEELGQEVEIIDHFYTTDFFIPSAFRSTDQVMSIYYNVRLTLPQAFRLSTLRNDFKQVLQDEESFRWVKIESLHLEVFHFPADAQVAENIRTLWQSHATSK